MTDKHYYVTGDRFTSEQRKAIEKAGFFVYSLRSWDTGNGSQLEHRVIVNHEGDVITNFKALPDEPDAFEPDFYQYMENQGAIHNYKTFEPVLKTIEQQ